MPPPSSPSSTVSTSRRKVVAQSKVHLILGVYTRVSFSLPHNLPFDHTHTQLEVEEDEAFAQRLAARAEGSNRQEQQQRRMLMEQENKALTVRLNNELEDVRYVPTCHICGYRQLSPLQSFPPTHSHSCNQHPTA